MPTHGSKTEKTPWPLYDTNHQPKLAYTTLTSMIPVGVGRRRNPGGNDKPIEPNEYGWYFQSTFEGDTDSWEGRGSADVLTRRQNCLCGQCEALLVQNRRSVWNGAGRTLNPKAFVPGKEYNFSVNVEYFDGDATDQFFLKLVYTDANGEAQYATVAEELPSRVSGTAANKTIRFRRCHEWCCMPKPQKV